jgi:DNA-binding transcriptional MerR regulator
MLPVGRFSERAVLERPDWTTDVIDIRDHGRRPGRFLTRTLDITNRVLCNQIVIAQDPIDGIIPEGLVATDAHTIAGITYRQLDHWARQGWVTPSVDAGQGRSGRRRYSGRDVVRLALLCKLARSKVNAAQAGPTVAAFSVPESDQLICWGPVPSRDEDPSLVVTHRRELPEQLHDALGAWVVFDPAPTVAALRWHAEQASARAFAGPSMHSGVAAKKRVRRTA